MTTVQRGCPPKNGISSPRRSLRFSCTLPAASTAWSWKTDLAMSRPIMVVLIAGGSLAAGSDDRTLAHRCCRGRPPHLVHGGGDRGLGGRAAQHAGRAAPLLGASVTGPRQSTPL